MRSPPPPGPASPRASSPVLASVLPARHRRLRHLRSLALRDLTLEADRRPPGDRDRLFNLFFTLHETPQAEPLYASEVIWCSFNPTWSAVAPLEDFEHCPRDCCIFTARVWHLDTHTGVGPSPQALSLQSVDPSLALPASTMLLEFEINLCDLYYVGQDLASLSMLPPRTVFVELTDGFYVMDQTAFILRAASPALGISAKPDADGETAERGDARALTLEQVQKTFQRVAAAVDSKRQLEQEIAMYKDKVSEQLEASAKAREQARRRESARLRIQQLKRELTTQTTLLQRDSQKVQQMRGELRSRANGILDGQRALLENKHFLRLEQTNFVEEKRKQERMRHGLIARKKFLVAQLRFIFPISKARDQKTLQIFGLRLPNSDYAGCDEEEIAAALGYTCHLVVMLAKYLETPLRFPMQQQASRSTIEDHISQSNNVSFPLYSKGVERGRFDYGVYLLNKNIEQLLHAQGLPVKLRNTLPNLQILLSSDKIGQGDPLGSDALGPTSESAPRRLSHSQAPPRIASPPPRLQSPPPSISSASSSTVVSPAGSSALRSVS